MRHKSEAGEVAGKWLISVNPCTPRLKEMENSEISEAIKSTTELLKTLEEIYQKEKMASWGCLNDTRMRMEARIGRLYNYLDELMEKIKPPKSLEKN